MVRPGTFGEVGAKYKNKYRSLTYNIKDAKNDGLFRRILLKDLSPIEVILRECSSKSYLNILNVHCNLLVLVGVIVVVVVYQCSIISTMIQRVPCALLY